MNTEQILRNQELRQRLSLLVKWRSPDDGPHLNGHSAGAAPQPHSSGPVDLIVTHNEVNRRHGTGVLLKNMFLDSRRLVSVRARNDYGGDHDFGAASFCLPSPELSRIEMFNTLGGWLGAMEVRRILCVPYYADSVLAAIAAKQLSGALLCTYIMDDANIHGSGIPDALMEELLRVSDLRLAISPEMRIAYETKYRRKFWLLPPTVGPDLIASRCNLQPAQASRSPRGVLIGNIWAQPWLELLQEAVSGANVTIDWYCSNGSAPGWLNINAQALMAAGIRMHDPLPEAELAPVLRGYDFAVLPSGTSDPRTEQRAIALLSLPTRVPFIAATSNLPIIVLGSPETAAARFVKRFRIGVCCEYDSARLRDAVREVTDPQQGTVMRRNAFEIGRNFSGASIADWMWESLERGEAADARFEALMPPLDSDFAYYVETNPPKDIYPDFAPAYLALRRLYLMGYRPDFVLDIGASNGVWSHFVCRIFPAARFILVEPLLSQYRERTTDFFLKTHPEFETVEAALSDRPGTLPLHISSNLYGSSFVSEGLHCPASEIVEVPVATLDSLFQDKRISGRGLLKLDVQNAEHLVLAGGANGLEQIDVVVMETTLARVPQGTKDFAGMLEFMDGRGFKYFDDCGEWRSAATGVLEQKDVVFVRKSLSLLDR